MRSRHKHKELFNSLVLRNFLTFLHKKNDNGSLDIYGTRNYNKHWKQEQLCTSHDKYIINIYNKKTLLRFMIVPFS